MNVLSLFDGMSCGRIALDRAGIKVNNYYASEIDKHAIKVSKANYPDIIHVGDVNNWRSWGLNSIDMVIAGSPCQGFSFAGKQLAFEDPRSALFFVMMDIVNYYNPSYRFLENVKMLDCHANVISDYMGVTPVLINSSLVSAQNRQRYYWFNWNAPIPKHNSVFWGDVRQSNVPDSKIYYSPKAMRWINNHAQRKNKELKIHTDSEKMQMVEASHYKKYSSQRFFGINDTHGIRYITPIECERLQTVPDNYTNHVSNTQRYKMLGNGWTVDVVAHLFSYINKQCDPYDLFTASQIII